MVQSVLSALVLSAALSYLPSDIVSSETVEVVEMNHYFDKGGDLVFDQVIFWDWDSQTEDYRVRAWRFVKSQDQIPRKDFDRGGYVTFWQDQGDLRMIKTRNWFETWTQYDPEVYDRQFIPQCKRRGLSNNLRR